MPGCWPGSRPSRSATTWSSQRSWLRSVSVIEPNSAPSFCIAAWNAVANAFCPFGVTCSARTRRSAGSRPALQIAHAFEGIDERNHLARRDLECLPAGLLGDALVDGDLS